MTQSGRPISFKVPRSQRFHWWLVTILSIWASGIASQAVISLSFDDPSIVYTGDWVDNGDHIFTSSTGASLVFTFTGTGISYISRHNPNGGIAQISFDGQSILPLLDESENTNPGDAPQETILFSKSGLDGSQSHVFELVYENVGQFGGPVVEVYGFEYVQNGVAPTSLASELPVLQSTTGTLVLPSASQSSLARSSTSRSSASTSSNLTSSTSPPPTSPSSSSPLKAGPTASSQPSSLSSFHSKTARSTLIGGIVGGILGGVLGGVLLSILGLCLFRRRAARRTRGAMALERRAHPYTLRPDNEDGPRCAPRSPMDSIFLIRRKAAIPALSEQIMHDESQRPMQQTGANLAPALGPTREGSGLDNSGAASALADAQASAGPTEAPTRASIGSDNGSHENPPSYSHPPSYSRVPGRYAPQRLASDSVPKA